MRVIVCGSREWKDGLKVFAELDRLIAEAGGELTVVHGACPKGADEWAHKWVVSTRGAKQQRYPAQWHKHGVTAGPIRNLEMAQSEPKPNLCLAFWDGESRGTKSMIAEAEREGIQVRIVRPPSTDGEGGEK